MCHPTTKKDQYKETNSFYKKYFLVQEKSTFQPERSIMKTLLDSLQRFNFSIATRPFSEIFSQSILTLALDGVKTI